MPKTTREAMSGKFGDWREAAGKEYYPLEDAGHIKLVNHPGPGVKVVPTLVRYTVKSDGRKS